MFKVTFLIFLSSFITSSYSEEIKVIVECNVPVPMRDGTILRADVHRPDHGGPYPVLVQRTPHGKKGFFDDFVKAGYIVVSQDARGRYESGGTFKGYFTPRELTHDAEDGYDTVEWAARVSGSNGKVGTFGTSYDALFQWRLAPLRPPSLYAMSACSIMAHFDNDHGAFRPLFFAFGNIYVPDMRRRANRPGVHTVIEARTLWSQGESEKWLNWLPWLELPREVFEDETEAVRHWLKNKHIDPWRHDEGCKEIAVPNLDVVGWYDHAHGNMLLYQTMAKEAKSEIARKGSRLIIGPWTHSLGHRYVGDMDFGSNAERNITALRIRWFDYWLKGVPNGVDKDSSVRIFVMGDNGWRDEEGWPLKRAEEKVFFIASDKRANSAGGDGRLIVEKPHPLGTNKYDYDPNDPVPTLGSSQFEVVIRTASDQRPLAERQDILVYQTQPLTERVEITGFPAVELYASTSAPDTDWFVRLIDVYPDGLALDVSQGFVRARYRNGLDKPELIHPGEVVKFLIRMKPMSNAFLPGHRIRLDITSSDFPNYDRHHNTAADQYADSVLAVAGQTVFHGGSQATRIILPWVSNPKEGVPVKEEDKPQTTPITYPLHQAATEGGIEQVKLLIAQDIGINVQNAEGDTPLCCAIQAKKPEASQLLIDAGADVNAGLWPPLYYAVDANDISTVEKLIARGANVNPPQFWTPLQQAPYSGSIEMVELLIDKGADIDVGPWTVWQGAIEKGRLDVMKLLIQRGLDLNTEEEKNGMALLSFAILVNANDEMIDFLLARGADLARIRNKSGLTVLHFLASNGYKKIDRLGPAIGDNVDVRDGVYGFTALHYAARSGHKDFAEVLIAHGADIKAKDKWDYQPIHWAAYHDRADIVELLIAKGADVNARTSLDQTPLQLAVPRRNTAAIEVLRKYSNQIDASTVINVTNSDKSYVVLERGDVRAVIVNNEPVDDGVLPGHRGGYSGVASLTHSARDKNLFVPFYAGLNFEHIHDGTVKPRDILFEPRQAPMQIRQIDEYTAELYQPPTPHWQLESWLRYQLLDDGAIEMTLECIPRARTFKNDYIGLFFASYIDKPESLDIHFLGRPADENSAVLRTPYGEPRWIRGVTPEHGKLPTHLAVDDNRNFDHDPNFPLTLVFNKSHYRYTEPWYYGVSHGMALVLMFRPDDNVRLSQSPSGGGSGNPAWDFQWFVPQYKVGQRYRFVMRAMYLPFESQQQIIRATTRHRADMEQQ